MSEFQMTHVQASPLPALTPEDLRCSSLMSPARMDSSVPSGKSAKVKDQRKRASSSNITGLDEPGARQETQRAQKPQTVQRDQPKAAQPRQRYTFKQNPREKEIRLLQELYYELVQNQPRFQKLSLEQLLQLQEEQSLREQFSLQPTHAKHQRDVNLEQSTIQSSLNHLSSPRDQQGLMEPPEKRSEQPDEHQQLPHDPAAERVQEVLPDSIQKPGCQQQQQEQNESKRHGDTDSLTPAKKRRSDHSPPKEQLELKQCAEESPQLQAQEAPVGELSYQLQLPQTSLMTNANVDPLLTSSPTAPPSAAADPRSDPKPGSLLSAWAESRELGLPARPAKFAVDADQQDVVDLSLPFTRRVAQSHSQPTESGRGQKRAPEFSKEFPLIPPARGPAAGDVARAGPSPAVPLSSDELRGPPPPHEAGNIAPQERSVSDMQRIQQDLTKFLLNIQPRGAHDQASSSNRGRGQRRAQEISKRDSPLPMHQEPVPQQYGERPDDLTGFLKQNALQRPQPPVGNSGTLSQMKEIVRSLPPKKQRYSRKSQKAHAQSEQDEQTRRAQLLQDFERNQRMLLSGLGVAQLLPTELMPQQRVEQPKPPEQQYEQLRQSPRKLPRPYEQMRLSPLRLPQPQPKKQRKSTKKQTAHEQELHANQQAQLQAQSVVLQQPQMGHHSFEQYTQQPGDFNRLEVPQGLRDLLMQQMNSPGGADSTEGYRPRC